MCGISGYYCFGLKRPFKSEVEQLLHEIDSRGKDATGVGFIHDGKLRVIKQAGTAFEFVKGNDSWKALNTMPPTMLLHTRKSTQGSPRDNMNNHPIFNKDGMALIHNGILWNEKSVAEEMGIKFDGEVDSEILLRVMEKGWWKDIQNINKVSGSFACASLYAKKPDELILFRSSQPIVLFMDVDRDILFFSSTKSALNNVFSVYWRGFMSKQPIAYEMVNDTAILVNKNGLEDVTKLSPTKRGYANNNGYYCEGNFYTPAEKRTSDFFARGTERRCNQIL